MSINYLKIYISLFLLIQLSGCSESKNNSTDLLWFSNYENDLLDLLKQSPSKMILEDKLFSINVQFNDSFNQKNQTFIQLSDFSEYGRINQYINFQNKLFLISYNDDTSFFGHPSFTHNNTIFVRLINNKYKAILITIGLKKCPTDVPVYLSINSLQKFLKNNRDNHYEFILFSNITKNDIIKYYPFLNDRRLIYKQIKPLTINIDFSYPLENGQFFTMIKFK